MSPESVQTSPASVPTQEGGAQHHREGAGAAAARQIQTNFRGRDGGGNEIEWRLSFVLQLLLLLHSERVFDFFLIQFNFEFRNAIKSFNMNS